MQSGRNCFTLNGSMEFVLLENLLAAFDKEQSGGTCIALNYFIVGH